MADVKKVLVMLCDLQCEVFVNFRATFLLNIQQQSYAHSDQKMSL